MYLLRPNEMFFVEYDVALFLLIRIKKGPFIRKLSITAVY